MTDRKTLDEYISVVVHDLRGPLVGIRETMNLLLEDQDVSLPMLHADLVAQARLEADRLMKLVNSILDASKARSEVGEIRQDRVNVQLLVRRAALGIKPAAEKADILLDAEVPADLPSIRGDADKLMQALNNLIVNAFKFTPRGGVVLLWAAEHTDSGGQQRLVIGVTDSGPGIPTDKRDELFSRFSEIGTASDKDVASTGMGLSITAAIVEGHGGEITLASVPGVGTSFLIDLPATEEPSSSDSWWKSTPDSGIVS